MNDAEPTPNFEVPPVDEKPRTSPWVFRIQAILVAALLLAIFYVEENWRGKRVWLKTKAEIEAKGEKLDWLSYIPKTPPPERNMFKAPGMEDLLVRGRGENIKTISIPPPPTNGPKATNYILYGLVEIVPQADAARLPKDAVVYDFETLKGSPVASRELSKAIVGRKMAAPHGMTILEKPLGRDVKRVYLKAEKVPSLKDVADALGTPDRVDPVSSNVFGLIATKWRETAEDFLEWSHREHDKVFAAVQNAAKRPECWVPGDYADPIETPIQNFVRARTLAQLRGARAQSCILLNRPDEAYEEIRRIDDLKRFMRSDPLTLVGAMIHTAIAGLQSSVIADGFEAGVWREKHLQGFQKLDPDAALLPPVVRAMRGGERAAVLHFTEHGPRSDVLKIFDIIGAGKRSSFNPAGLLFRSMPRGWVYLNMAEYARMMQISVERAEMLSDLGKHRGEWLQTADFIEQTLSQKSPALILAGIAIPNFQKAGQTTLKNQVTEFQVVIAAGLERYRLQKGVYPESLEVLVPEFVEKIPIDIASGKPMRYQKRANGEYALYSVGIDGLDDMVPLLAAKDRPMREIIESEAAKRDWVWRGVPENAMRTDRSHVQK
jgi:hypothetical protein